MAPINKSAALNFEKVPASLVFKLWAQYGDDITNISSYIPPKPKRKSKSKVKVELEVVLETGERGTGRYPMYRHLFTREERDDYMYALFL